MEARELQILIEEVLRGVGWEEPPGYALVGFTIAVHTTQLPDQESCGCEIIHFGAPEFRHDALHAISEMASEMVEDDHAKSGMYN